MVTCTSEALSRKTLFYSQTGEDAEKASGDRLSFGSLGLPVPSLPGWLTPYHHWVILPLWPLSPSLLHARPPPSPGPWTRSLPANSAHHQGRPPGSGSWCLHLIIPLHSQTGGQQVPQHRLRHWASSLGREGLQLSAAQYKREGPPVIEVGELVQKTSLKNISTVLGEQWQGRGTYQRSRGWQHCRIWIGFVRGRGAGTGRLPFAMGRTGSQDAFPEESTPLQCLPLAGCA